MDHLRCNRNKKKMNQNRVKYSHVLAEQKLETYAMTKTKSVTAKHKKIDRFILLFG